MNQKKLIQTMRCYQSLNKEIHEKHVKEKIMQVTGNSNKDKHYMTIIVMKI